MNGIWSKIGNAAEKRVVCQQWLHLLSGSVDRVQWEAWEQEGFDAQGVDLWVMEEGKRIAIQCKTKSTGPWKPSDLGVKGSNTRSIKDYIRAQLLDRVDPADSYVFCSDNTHFEGLTPLLSRAQGNDRGMPLTSSEEKVLEILGFDSIEVGKSLLAKIEIQPMPTESNLRRFANLLVEKGSESILWNALQAMPEKEVLGRELGVNDLKLLLKERSPGIQWKKVDAHAVLGDVAKQTANSLDILEAKKALPIEIERQETTEMIRVLREEWGTQMLVHGAPGTGKSHVLASVAKELAKEKSMNVLLTRATDIGGHSNALQPETLKRVYRNPLVVIVDQWDSMELAGGDVEKLKGMAFAFCRACLEMGFTLVVGCRTVDTRDSSLRNLFANRETAKYHEVEIGGLPVSDVESVLNTWHIPWNVLGPDLQRWVRNPECLGLLGDLAREPDFDGTRPFTQLGFVGYWINLRTQKVPGSREALDRLVAKMERLGKQKISSAQADPDGEILEKAGLFVRISQEGILYFEPRHQLIVDACIATQLGNCGTLHELLALMGKRAEQHFLHARRMRLSVPLILESSKGWALLNEVQRSEEIRPLVKRGMWLGLADILEPKERDFHVIHAWMDEAHAPHILTQVFALHPGWMKLYIDWALQQGEALDKMERDRIVGLFASVSGILGDEIAEALNVWSKEDPDLLRRGEIESLFWQKPEQDSDKLFELRLTWEKLPEWMLSANHTFDWRALFREAPKRALLLLEKYVRHMDAGKASSGLHSRHRSLTLALKEVPQPFVFLGAEVFQVLSGAWKALDVQTYKWDEHILDVHRNSELDLLIRSLAACNAHGLSNQKLTFAEFMELLPTPLRKHDIQLILETGILLGGKEIDTSLADDFATWLIGCPEAIRVGIRNSFSFVIIHGIHRFVEKLTPKMSTVCLDTLVEWIASIRDPWTVKDEKQRWEQVKKYGFSPNQVGKTSHRLLGAIPESVRNEIPRARARYLELEAKFGPRETGQTNTQAYEPRFFGTSYITPLHVMRKWSVNEWRKAFHNAPLETDIRSLDLKTNTVRHKSMDALVDSFRTLALENPQAYFQLGNEFQDLLADIPGEALSTMIDAIATDKNPDPKKYKEWTRVETPDLAPWLIKSGLYLHEGCEMELARVVETRSEDLWPEVIYQRLMDIAISDPSPMDWANDDDPDLLNVCWNMPNCRAIHALAVCAGTHEDLLNPLLEIAESLVSRADPAVLTSTVILAATCFQENPKRATEIILTCGRNPKVRGQPSTMRALWFLCQQEEKVSKKNHEDAIALLLANRVLTKGHLVEWAAYSMFALALNGLIPLEILVENIDENAALRSAMVSEVLEKLNDPDAEIWLQDLAINFANDTNEDVRKHLARRLAIHAETVWMKNQAFVNRLLDSQMAGDHAASLSKLFDQNARLSMFTEGILRVAKDFALQAPRSDVSAWEWAHRKRDIEGLLRRLAESLQREERLEDLASVLDVFDDLLERHPDFGTQSLRELSALG
ncbi:MAG: AAA family ATPase [Kiritimatiellae bacterium]|nr:AAA family ATPase [Kiritimatiellia bacterium]